MIVVVLRAYYDGLLVLTLGDRTIDPERQLLRNGSVKKSWRSGASPVPGMWWSIAYSFWISTMDDERMAWGFCRLTIDGEQIA